VNRRLTLASVAPLALATVGSLILVAAPSAGQTSPAKRSALPAKTAAAPASASPQVSLATVSVGVVNDIDPTKAFGSKNAPVVMEIYSDFQCPACKQLFMQTTQRVMDNYVNSNKVYVVHRDFPLPMHAYSRVAASYSRAAAHIGRCEVVEQALFQNQEKWEQNGDVKGIVASVLSPAEMKKVQAIVDSHAVEPLIEKDKQLGQMVPVNQTPTSIIHTKDGQSYPVVGFVSFDVLRTLLDQVAK
jgi:protein-disulfide isomerase